RHRVLHSFPTRRSSDLARVGGRCIAMKGITAEQETADARQALQILGGQVQRMESIQLPDVSDPHYLVVVDKIDATPKAYPRNPGDRKSTRLNSSHVKIS